MRGLIINTALSATQVLVVDGAKRFFEQGISGEQHSKSIMQKIDVAFERSGLRLDECDFFAVVVGPGSFTGIRIGVSIIKALGFSKNVPVIALDTLELLSTGESYNNDKKLFAILKGVADEWFIRNQSAKVPQSKLTTENDLIAMLDGDCVVCHLEGEQPNTKSAIALSCDITEEKLFFGAKQKYDAKDFSTAQSIQPQYLRLSQAELQKKDCKK